MDVIVVVGWDEIQAVEILSKLGCIPKETETGDGVDAAEYACSDDGISGINLALRTINYNCGTELKWVIYPGEHFVLVWRTEFEKTIGEPFDAPNNKYYLDTEFEGLKLTRLKTDYKGITNPYTIMILDATSFYHHHIYDNPDEKMDDDPDDGLDSNPINPPFNIYATKSQKIDTTSSSAILYDDEIDTEHYDM